jgi:hypothetical protein
MKKSVILVLITSIFFIQCFSPFEITKDEFLLDAELKSLGAITSDGYEYLFDQNRAIFEMKFDSLLLISYVKIDPVLGFSYFGTDTLKMNKIKSVYVSKFDGLETLLWLSGIVGVLGLIFYLTFDIGSVSLGGGSL